MKHNLRAAVAALALTLLTSCGGGSDASAHNRADVTFVQEMIPHHRQAVAMSRLVASRDVGPGVTDLARRIEKAQGPEITTMTGWLRSWGEDAGSSSGHGSMDGMMSQADMTALDAAQGKTFARLYLTQMIEHHTGAVAMARKEQADGENQAAQDLAQDIETSQTSEIKEMKQLLAGG